LLRPDIKELMSVEKEFLAFKNKAYRDGFCKENSLLWTKHAFMDTIYNQIDLYSEY
jgi:hypothetical protein